MKTYLCTLDEARREIKAAGTTDNAFVLSRIPTISQRMCRLAGKQFEPYYETRTVHVTPYITTGHVLDIGRPMLEVVSVTFNGVSLALDTDVALDPVSTDLPRRKLRWLTQARSWFERASSVPHLDPLVEVTAWWGWRSRYAEEGWRPTGDVVRNAGGLSAADKTMRVDDADGMDEVGLTPRFSPGQLLRIDDELLRVLAVNTTTNDVTVLRGVRGTTAAAHAENSEIATWDVEEDIGVAVQRWVALSYQRRAVFETRTVTDVGTVSTPADIPREAYATAQQYVNL